MGGLARMAELGAHLLIEDNFVSGPAAQQGWRAALAHLPVTWVGVHCDPATAARRELARGDRTAGMAQQQAESLHLGIDDDVTVDSTDHSPDALAHEIVELTGAASAAIGLVASSASTAADASSAFRTRKGSSADPPAHPRDRSQRR